ncbi:hypothetical protein G6011_03188 [Alternaria panax]|uniref:Zn(2)-C6 fungal-type domain-containing protein n=1 Tax=Alternaria panax TaxID=48097 RepID=A0AAD4IES8_9PLEO|nr:hypothetical protein G6011_03188 [Alternaria panax]
MSSDIPTPELSSDALSPLAAASKPQRVLSCVLCAHRKVKCDRKSPCSNCIKAGAQCTSAATIPRQRRRRFPERELLDRLRHYEDLLKKNGIAFQPLHTSSNPLARLEEIRDSRDQEETRPQSSFTGDTENAQAKYEEAVALEADTSDFNRSFWHAMNRKAYDADDNTSDDDSDHSGSSRHVLRQTQIVKAWDYLYSHELHRSQDLLFCSRSADVSLSTLHPPQAQIFKLWQLYLENVDPLLKLTHTPTLQARIIDAASDISNIDPNLEALMFSIYCMAIFSLDQEQCQSIFGRPRPEIIRGYQLGAREALVSCDFLKSSNRECLTALHLYLISLKPDTDPRSLSSMLGAAVRIAQRMGIDTESTNARHSVLEAELRRRLWWSLSLFDDRMAEMTECKTTSLLPTWDCKSPLNVNDFSLRAEMTTPPAEFGVLSEALFAVMRSQIGEFVRQSSSHLDFVNPALKKFSKKASGSTNSELDEITVFDSTMEKKYLAHCDAQNPLHFLTIWTARASLAKIGFAHYLSSNSQKFGQEDDEQRDLGFAFALRLLECDTMLMTSPLIKNFRWVVYLNFPFPVYVHLVQALKRRPLGEHADRSWQAMSDNCAARLTDLEKKDSPIETKPNNPFFTIFAGLVLQAWTAREAVSAQSEPPKIVTDIKRKMALVNEKAAEVQFQTPGSGGTNSQTSELMGLGSLGPHLGATGGMNIDSGAFAMDLTQAPINFNGSPWTWPIPNWSAMPGQGW